MFRFSAYGTRDFFFVRVLSYFFFIIFFCFVCFKKLCVFRCTFIVASVSLVASVAYRCLFRFFSEI